MREILTKQSNLRKSSVCARYERYHQTTDSPQCVRDTNETIQLKAILIVREMLTKQSRRSLSYSRLYPQFKYMTFIYSQPIKLKKILSVREILTKQSNYRLSSVCARYKRNNPTKDNPHCAREINETIKLKTILSVRVISTKQSR